MEGSWAETAEAEAGDEAEGAERLRVGCAVAERGEAREARRAREDRAAAAERLGKAAGSQRPNERPEEGEAPDDAGACGGETPTGLGEDRGECPPVDDEFVAVEDHDEPSRAGSPA